MITVFTSPDCAFCHALKEYLHDNKIKFTEKNIIKDLDAQKWVLETTNRLSVPVIKIDNRIIVGFNRPHIESVLKDKKLISDD